MIQYTEKGEGLHRAIVAAGHWLEYRAGDGYPGEGAWVASDEAVVQAIIDAYPLANYQAELRAKVERHAAAVLDRFMAVLNYSPWEASSWSALEAQARALLAGGDPGQAPKIVSEAQASGKTPAQIAARVVANADALQAFLDAVKAVRTAHKDAISACGSFSDARALDVMTGWPG